jgi:hypothetical protein
LFDIFLEEPESQSLMQLDLLLVPLGLQGPVVSQDVVDHRQDVAGTLGVVAGVILGSLWKTTQVD